MASRALALAALLLAALARPAAAARELLASQCPPAGFDALPAGSFDIEAYISARWFVQKQMPVVYQPRRNLYCVFAEYKWIDPASKEKGLLVNNYSNRDKVEGEVRGTSEVGAYRSPRTIAKVPDASRPSKLRVGIAPFGGDTFAGRMLGRGGDYWIAAAGVSENVADRSGNAYDWAIVTGGVPRRPVGDKCSTGSRLGLVRRVSTNNVGLWLFTRKPIDPVNTQLMLNKLAELGLDASELVDVQHQGCTYHCGPGNEPNCSSTYQS